jgi:hypothetical protein
MIDQSLSQDVNFGRKELSILRYVLRDWFRWSRDPHFRRLL